MPYTCLLGYYVVLRLVGYYDYWILSVYSWIQKNLFCHPPAHSYVKFGEMLIGCKLGQGFQKEYAGEALEKCLGQNKTTLHRLWLLGETLTG